MILLSRYEAGEVIIQENDLGETAYVITQGQVEVSKEKDGHKIHLAYLGTGEIFGEMSMIDEKPRSATVTAVTETLVSEIRRDDFFNSFQTDPIARRSVDHPPMSLGCYPGRQSLPALPL